MNNGVKTIGGDLVLPPLEDFTFDDVSNARLFASRYRTMIRWQGDAGKWLVWEKTHWKADSTGFVMLIAQAFAKSLYDLVPEIVRSKEELQTGYRHAKRSNNVAGIRAFLELAKSEMTVNSSDLDRDHYLLNTLSGTIDLKTGELKKHDPTDYLTKLCPFHYNVDADCSTWLEFLETILPDESVRTYVQRAIGYSLTGAVRERAFFICYGFGRNGKSVFIDTISKLLGDYARNTTADSLMRKQTGSIPNDVARLKGARFVTTAETDEGKQLHESLIKSLTGGDRITARYLFNEYFDFYFEGKLWLATNHKPVIKDQSNGMWDRIKLIPFSTTIAPDQAIDKDELVELLLGEAAGILAWAVEGCLQWQREKRLITPQAIETEVDQYKFEQDSIAQFIEECCETIEQAKQRNPDVYLIQSDFKVQNGDLYKAYKQFCDANGEYMRSHRRLTQNMHERGFKQRNSGGRYWEGIRLNDPEAN